MNSVIWILAGGLIGWFAYSYFDRNAARGLIASVVIGGLSGFFGGKVIGPVVGADISAAGEFSIFALVLAIAAAVTAIAVADAVSERWGV